MQIIGKPLHIPVIQSRVDLVQNTEGRGTHLQNGKIQRRSHKGLLAAGEQRDGFHLLSGGLHPDFDAAGQGIFRILQNQLSLAAAEHLLKGHAEVVVDLAEFLHENGGHFLGDVPDDVF